MQSKTRTYTAICVAGTALLALIAFFSNPHINDFDALLFLISIPYLSALLIGTLTAIDAILHTSDADTSENGGRQHNIPIIMAVLAVVWNFAVTAIALSGTANAHIILGYPAFLFIIVQTVLFCCSVLMHRQRDEKIRIVPLIITLASATVVLSLGLMVLF